MRGARARSVRGSIKGRLFPFADEMGTMDLALTRGGPRVKRNNRYAIHCASVRGEPRPVLIARASAWIQVATVLTCLAMSAGGCGFMSMVFKGENREQMRQTGICDDLAAQFAAEVPSMIELRTDKAGATSYRDLRLAGTDVDPQWVPIATKGNAAGWLPAHNFTRMDFEPPLRPALKPGSVLYVAYAPADVRNSTEQGQLKTFDSAFGPASGTFRWNGREYHYSALHELPCLPPPQ